MTVNVIQRLVPRSKYSIKCPYEMTPIGITIHNTANDASAENEVKYMINNNKEVSFHYAVDETGAVQGVPTDRNAWHAGDANGDGNRKTIAIEICYSKSGGAKFAAAEKNAASLTAEILKDHGWDTSRVYRHMDWSGKYCPHRTMDEGWDRFIDMVREAMKNTEQSDEKHVPDIYYRAYTSRWWSWVRNCSNYGTEGYAGVIGEPLRGLQAYTKGEASSVGKLKYRLHRKSGTWYNWQIDREKDKNGENFAGDMKSNFDMLQMELTGVEGMQVEYRVYAAEKGWLPWVRGYNETDTDGYAGWKGYDIQCVQVRIVRV